MIRALIFWMLFYQEKSIIPLPSMAEIIFFEKLTAN